MSITIETEKTVTDGKKRRVILSISGVLPFKSLPSEYMEVGSGPSVYWSDISNGLCTDKANLYAGGEYDEAKFQETLENIHDAGKRLHFINQKIKRLKEEWNGRETFQL